MRTLFIFSILLLLPLSLWAGVGFVHESGFSVTPFSPTLSTTQIVKLNDSGSIGFLWHSGSEVRLYDPEEDSIIFSRVRDTSVVVLAALVGDFSGDSVFDIVIASATNIWTFEPTEWSVACFDGASAYAESTTVSYTSNTVSVYYFVGVVSDLIGADLDHNGDNELVFSYNNVSGSSWGEDVGGYSVAFNRFPDSLLWSESHLITGLFSLEDANGTTRNLCRTFSDWYMDFGPDTKSTNSPIEFLHDNGTTTWISPACADSGCDGGGGFNSCGYSAITIGDVSSVFGGEELLAIRMHSFYCPYDGGTSSSAELMLFSLDATTPTNDLNVIWSLPYLTLPTGLGHFMVHPDLPGYFFGIAGDTLIMFNGDNGSIRATTTDIPSGQRYWDNNWPDSLPRLVVMNGHQVDIYSMDITTELGDEQAHTTPQTFLLGKPYPNPFNVETTIPINQPKRGNLKVEIYNLLGQTVVTLVDRELPAGETRLTWDASEKPSGVYLVRAVSGDKTETRKLLLLK